MDDKVYCFVCRDFSTSLNIRDQNETLIKSGFSKWKKLSEVLKKHDVSHFHRQCNECYVGYKQSCATENVHDKLVSHHEQEVVKNQIYLSKLIDIIAFLGRQGLAFRGHLESCLLYTSPSPRDRTRSRMPSSA